MPAFHFWWGGALLTAPDMFRTPLGHIGTRANPMRACRTHIPRLGNARRVIRLGRDAHVLKRRVCGVQSSSRHIEPPQITRRVWSSLKETKSFVVLVLVPSDRF